MNYELIKIQNYLSRPAFCLSYCQAKKSFRYTSMSMLADGGIFWYTL